MATGTFADFIGQTALKEKIRSTMRLALASGDTLPHIFLSGSQEMGKVTFARAIAREMGVTAHEVPGNNILDTPTFFRHT